MVGHMAHQKQIKWLAFISNIVMTFTQRASVFVVHNWNSRQIFVNNHQASDIE
jgi:hypothetical protein